MAVQAWLRSSVHLGVEEAQSIASVLLEKEDILEVKDLRNAHRLALFNRVVCRHVSSSVCSTMKDAIADGGHRSVESQRFGTDQASNALDQNTRPTCDQTNSSVAVFFAMPRTGSSMLGALLGAHPQIMHFSELYRRRDAEETERSAGIYPDTIWKGPPSRLPEPLLAALARARRDPGPLLDAMGCTRDLWHKRPVHAFKLFGYDHRGNEHLPRDLISAQIIGEARRTAFVILMRRDVMRTYISLQASIKTHHWSKTNQTATRVLVEPLRFLAWERRYREWYDWVRQQLRAWSRPYLELSYEEIEQDAERALERVQRHLGVEVLPLEKLRTLGGATVARYSKQSDENVPIEARVQNFDELAAAARVHSMFARGPLPDEG